jgi:hypothetical protein
MVSGVLFGLAPALQAAGQDVVAGLKDVGGGRRRTRLRGILVASQVALCWRRARRSWYPRSGGSRWPTLDSVPSRFTAA